MNKFDSINAWDYSTSGIPDEIFIRGEVPMTKQEVRAITLSKLRLKEEMIVWDIGAGTGSISIEAGLQCSKGKVYAIEKNKDGISLIHENIRKFNVENIEVIEGSAPEALESLPHPDRVMIGGAGDNLVKILNHTHSVLKPQGRIVINSITIETLYDTLKWLEDYGYEEIDTVCVSISRVKRVGAKHMFKALNPIYIISGMKGEKA